MSLPGGLPAGLAFLPNWLNDAKDATTLDALLSGWVRASGWRGAGLVWPADANAVVALHAKADGTERLPRPPAEARDVLTSLKGGSWTVLWQMPNSSGRLYCAVTPPGQPTGLVWAERGAGEPWGELDRNYLRLSARLIERSPALAAQFGPQVDGDRLQQRLADASVIAGRMAHDFDNILTGIIGFADLTVPLLPAGSQPAKFVAEVGKVGQRGIQFTQQLHQLSRSGQSKPQAGGLSAAVAKEVNRLKPSLADGAQVVTDLPAVANAVAIESTPLGVALGHLIENAADATPAGGRIVVSSRVVELSAADAKGYLGAAGPGPHVEVTVRDTGPGIKPEVRAKLFVEPFFTTKVRRRGLGLAIVYRTLFAHRGGIRIENAAAPETGTVVRVVLPPAARPVPASSVVTTTATALRG